METFVPMNLFETFVPLTPKILIDFHVESQFYITLLPLG